MTSEFVTAKLVFERHVFGTGRLAVRQIWTVTLWEGPVEAKVRSSTSLRAESHVSKTPVSKKTTCKLPRLSPNLAHSRLRDRLSTNVAKHCHFSDFSANLVVNHRRNQRRSEMKAAVTTVLAERISSAYSVGRVWRLTVLVKLQTESADRSLGHRRSP